MVPWRPTLERFKAVTLCLRRLQETPNHSQKFVVVDQLPAAVKAVSFGAKVILDLKAIRADWSVKLLEDWDVWGMHGCTKRKAKSRSKRMDGISISIMTWLVCKGDTEKKAWVCKKDSLSLIYRRQFDSCWWVGGCSYRVVVEFNHMCEHNIILLPWKSWPTSTLWTNYG